MQKFVGRVLTAFAFFVALVLSPSANTASITIAPDSLFGYIPLSLFGVTPTPIGDEAIINFNVPNFQWAGQTWDRIGIDSNGYAVVGGGSSVDNTFLPSAFPNAAAPNNVLAPFWTDLDPGQSGGVRATTLTDGVRTWIVVDWAEVPVFGTSITKSFEIWLGINGVEDITFAYGPNMNTNVNGQPLGIGAEDATGTVGANYLGALTDLRVSSEGFVAPPEVPLPAAFPLFATGLGALGLLGWWRKRKAQAAA